MNNFLKLYKVPWCGSSLRQPYFKSEESRNNYFNSLPFLEVNSTGLNINLLNGLRVDFKISEDITKIMDYNFAIFSYNDVLFYANIDDMSQLSVNRTLINCTRNVFVENVNFLSNFSSLHITKCTLKNPIYSNSPNFIIPNGYRIYEQDETDKFKSSFKSINILDKSIISNSIYIRKILEDYLYKANDDNLNPVYQESARTLEEVNSIRNITIETINCMVFTSSDDIPKTGSWKTGGTNFYGNSYNYYGELKNYRIGFFPLVERFAFRDYENDLHLCTQNFTNADIFLNKISPYLYTVFYTKIDVPVLQYNGIKYYLIPGTTNASYAYTSSNPVGDPPVEVSTQCKCCLMLNDKISMYSNKGNVQEWFEEYYVIEYKSDFSIKEVLKNYYIYFFDYSDPYKINSNLFSNNKSINITIEYRILFTDEGTNILFYPYSPSDGEDRAIKISEKNVAINKNFSDQSSFAISSEENFKAQNKYYDAITKSIVTQKISQGVTQSVIDGLSGATQIGSGAITKNPEAVTMGITNIIRSIGTAINTGVQASEISKQRNYNKMQEMAKPDIMNSSTSSSVNVNSMPGFYKVISENVCDEDFAVIEHSLSEYGYETELFRDSFDITEFAIDNNFYIQCDAICTYSYYDIVYDNLNAALVNGMRYLVI